MIRKNIYCIGIFLFICLIGSVSYAMEKDQSNKGTDSDTFGFRITHITKRKCGTLTSFTGSADQSDPTIKATYNSRTGVYTAHFTPPHGQQMNFENPIAVYDNLVQYNIILQCHHTLQRHKKK